MGFGRRWTVGQFRVGWTDWEGGKEGEGEAEGGREGKKEETTKENARRSRRRRREMIDKKERK